MGLADKIQRYVLALIIAPLVLAQSGVSLEELKEEAKRRGKLKEVEALERTLWLDVCLGFILFIIVLVILR